MSTRIFENVVDENLSALLKITPNHGFYGAEEVQNDVKDEKKGERWGRRGKNTTMQTFVFILILATLTIRTTLSKEHDLSGIVFKIRV